MENRKDTPYKPVKITQRLIDKIRKDPENCLACANWKPEDTARRSVWDGLIWGRCTAGNGWQGDTVLPYAGCDDLITYLTSAHDKAEREAELQRIVKVNEKTN